MSDENNTGEMPAENKNGSETQPKLSYETWIKDQPVEVQAMLTAETYGLQSALNKERKELEEMKKSRRDAEKRKSVEESKALEEQQAWKELAEKRATQATELETKVKELEPLQAKADRYAQALSKTLEAQRQGLPEHVLVLLDKLDPVDQLEYIAENADKFKEKKPGGVPPSPNGKQPQPQKPDYSGLKPIRF